MARVELSRLAILGAGPIGIEAALYAAHLGYPFQVFERGRVGEHLHRWGHVRLFSPFGMNVTPLGLASLPPGHGELPGEGDCITGREHLAAYLDPLSATALLRKRIHLQTEVLSIGRKGLLKGEGPGDAGRALYPFLLLVRGPDGKERLEEADVVLDCTGTYRQPRFLGQGGIPAVGESEARRHISYELDDILGEKRTHYADRNVLVLGAGYSAATTVCALAELGEEHPSTWVTWLARGSASQPIRRLLNDPLRERDGLAGRANRLATRGDGNVEFHPQSVVEAVQYQGEGKGFTVTARCGGKVRTWEVDRIIANVGYTPDNGLYRELQVHECYASCGPMRLAAALLKQAGGDCLTIGPQGPEALRNPEPNFFILGAKSYGRNTNFLMRNGFEQVREVFTLIADDPRLDLYAAPQTKGR
jgi:thioredoxin reductase